MSEVYKVGDTLLISFLLSTPFLRSISFRNRARYYFANNSSLRFRRNEKNIDLVLSFSLDAKKCIRKIEAFFTYLTYISIDRILHAHPACLHLLRKFYFTSARYKFANNTNLRFLYKIEERYRYDRTLSLVRERKSGNKIFSHPSAERDGSIVSHPGHCTIKPTDTMAGCVCLFINIRAETAIAVDIVTYGSAENRPDATFYT